MTNPPNQWVVIKKIRYPMLWLVAWTTSLPSSPSGPTADPSWRRTWLCNSYAVRSPHGKAGEMGMLCCYRKASSTAGRSHPPKALPEMQDCCKWFLIGAASLISFDSCFMDASKLVTGSVLSFLIVLVMVAYKWIVAGALYQNFWHQ